MFRILLLTLACSACASPGVVVQKELVETKVPVAAPCISGERPTEPTALRDKVDRGDWTSLSTDQREKLLQAQAQDRRAFGDQLTVATAACR